MLLPYPLMKTITCKQFGGPCDFAMTAATEKEMKDLAWKHTEQSHPEQYASTKEIMKNATKEQMAQTDAYFHKVWESVPDDK